MYKNILIVDDESDLLESIAELAEIMGFSVDTACDGRVALEKCQNKNFDFILSDIRMPEMSGVEFIKKLQELKPDICFAFMSGFSDYKNTELLKMGAKAVLAKPFMREDLEAILK